MNAIDDGTRTLIRDTWRDSIVPTLCEYVRIPNKSPAFAPDWQSAGHMQRAAQLLADWCREQPIAGMTVELLTLPGRTPVLLCDIPGELPDCVLLYGHLDKQPEFTGWEPGLSPWEPVIREGKLYGRGGADDGYAVFSSLTAIRALKSRGVPLARCVVLIEASEESGSTDLPAHLEALGARLGTPSLVICLDAECGNYSQLWCTTSLRGNLTGTLHVEVLRDGVHSGMGTGIAPTPLRVALQLLARIENPINGDILLPELQCPIPKDRIAQARVAAATLGAEVAGRVPLLPGVKALSTDPVELLLGSTWRSTLAVTGADGLPATANAGNVLLPRIALKLSLRLPPTIDAERASEALTQTLQREPPYGARVRFEADSAASGWNAPSFAPWLEESMQRASQTVFGREAVHAGCGGTIPFMGMLGRQFPQTQFLITGVLGPLSNAHGPNEFLELAYAEKITACVVQVLADHALNCAR
ncbi:MAG: M20/M25/M40 family metallo-hydrolase [Steroidobacteraceae bacterium]|jgi:acetylornithine deacetylase/succinyl-diaminopimelate desuccinylase-like protein|nr:M20/M25/M40 family metallo-hydrolase [Gammaproteobacteria bacterium]NCW21177.1 M20/M25/M40 family metallo-hydrolase [Gammaproteobacteria bacterium]